MNLDAKDLEALMQAYNEVSCKGRIEGVAMQRVNKVLTFRFTYCGDEGHYYYASYLVGLNEAVQISYEVYQKLS